MTEAATADGFDPNAKERRNVTLAMRWFAFFVAWPSLTIGFIFLLDPSEHWLHIAGLLPLGLAALVLLWKAPVLAQRFYPTS